jgi:hypothetical protein
MLNPDKKFDLYDKFRSCKWSEGELCFHPHTSWLGRIHDRLFGVPSHAVGVNGYSLKAHCGNCERYEPQKKEEYHRNKLTGIWGLEELESL